MANASDCVRCKSPLDEGEHGERCLVACVKADARPMVCYVCVVEKYGARYASRLVVAAEIATGLCMVHVAMPNLETRTALGLNSAPSREYDDDDDLDSEEILDDSKASITLDRYICAFCGDAPTVDPLDTACAVCRSAYKAKGFVALHTYDDEDRAERELELEAHQAVVRYFANRSNPSTDSANPSLN